MVEITGIIFAYFASIIAIITLDLFLGTTLLQFFCNLKQFPKVQDVISKAATSWGLLNWLLSIFLLLNGLNLLFVFLYRSLYISYVSRLIILISSMAPYILYLLQGRYEVLVSPSKNNIIKIFYPISVMIVLYASFCKIPFFTINIIQDRRWAVHLIWPSVVIIFFQIFNLAWYAIWQKILSAKDP
jgi:hypothetical protein